MSYDVGDIVPLGIIVTDSAGTQVDTTPVTLTITLPDGTTVTPTVANLSVGEYSVQYTTSQSGRHTYRWLAGGTYPGAHEGSFYVGAVQSIAADAERYATVGALAARITDRTTAVDALTTVLASASRAVENLCGRVFTLDAAATARLYAPRHSDLLIVDDIGAAGYTVRIGTPASWASFTDFTAYPLNALAKGWPVTDLRTDSGFAIATAQPTVEVTAQWGWPAVPEPVSEATLLLASRWFARRSSPAGVLGFGEYGVVRVTSADRDVEAMLAPYVQLIHHLIPPPDLGATDVDMHAMWTLTDDVGTKYQMDGLNWSGAYNAAAVAAWSPPPPPWATRLTFTVDSASVDVLLR